MRHLILLSIIVILLKSIHSTGANWIERMTKYGGLAECQYYVTSQTNFDHFIPINEIVTESQDEYLLQLKFHTTTQQSFKIYLAASNESIESTLYQSRYDSDSSLNYNYQQRRRHYYDYDSDDDYYPHTTQTTLAPALSESVAQGRNEIHKDHIGYQIQISSTQTYITTDKKPIKSLTTQNTLRYDEPNDVLINIFKDGQLKVAVNDIEAMHAHVEFGNQLKYFSFASGEDFRRAEFFYDCA